MSAVAYYNVFAGVTGLMVRFRIYPPGGGSTGTDFAATESPQGCYNFRGTMTVAQTAYEPYQIEARIVTAQTSGAFDAATALNNIVLARGDYAYSDGVGFCDTGNVASASSFTLQEVDG